VLPDEYKKEITEKFYEFLEWININNPQVITQATDIVNGVVNYMNSESYHKEYWNEFLSYTKKLDDIRQESIHDVEPKFKEYIQ
jgi:predicted RecB family nuclease